MNKTLTLVLFTAAFGSVAHAQIGRILDWHTFGGDIQRSGWEKSDSRFTKESLAKDFQFLWKVKPEGRGPRKLMPPVLVGTLVGSRGFKELAFIGGTDDSLHVIDADLDRMYWERRLDTAGKPKTAPTAACPGDMSAAPTLMALAFRRPGPRPAPAAAPSGPPARPAVGIFSPRSVYMISSAGKLHRVNIDSGEEYIKPVPVLPANAKASALNLNDSVIYLTTSGGCGGAANAVWAIDIADPDGAAPVKSFPSATGDFGGFGGPVIGTDGTVYAQSEGALLALTPKDLALKASYTAPAAPVTPVVFSYKEKDLIVTAGKDGRLNLLDSGSLGAPLSQTAPVGGLWGGLASWAEADGGTRWVLATTRTSIAAFKLEEKDGKPVLTADWTSRPLVNPVPPVIANGVAFALSNGDAAGKTHATLYALDANTGKEMWSTGSQVTVPGAMTGLTVVNGRVYFATADNTLWAFGVPLEW